MAIIAEIGAFILWAINGFRGKYLDVYMDNPFLAPLLGLVFIIIIVFLSFYLWK